MARKRTKTVSATASAAGTIGAGKSHGAAKTAKQNRLAELFSVMACKTAHLAGKPMAFLTATALVIVWALTGPLFGYSDTWQLVINTSTTIVTFLMVFLIQHTQNRDTLALQLKLSELIVNMRGAKNHLAAAEEFTEEQLERLHEEYRGYADDTLAALEKRRGQSAERAH